MQLTTYTVHLTFTEFVLGTVPKDTDIYTKFILSKATELSEDNAEEELSTVENLEVQGWTGFHTDENGPFLYNYLPLGFLKEACGMLRRDPTTLSKGITAYRKVIDGMVFVSPRRIYLSLPDGAEIDQLERPLRANTAQGERVALVRSDLAPAGTSITFDITVMGNIITEAVLREWLDYGQFRGLGQWRNSGAGTFTYTLTLKE